MTNDPKILRDCALMLPLLMAVGAAIGGWTVASATAVVGTLAVGNLWVLQRITGAMTRELAKEDGDAGMPALALGMKMIVAIPLVFVLTSLVGPIPVALGLCTVVLGVLKTGLESIAAPDIPEPAHATPGTERENR